MKPAKQIPRHVLCFSHLRWNFVFQRPQHLLTRCARLAAVTYFEEPVFEDVSSAELRVLPDHSGVNIVTPVLPVHMVHEQALVSQRELLHGYMEEQGIVDFIAWYYTPMALLFTGEISPVLTVYDCMDELSAFDGAPPQMVELEQKLFSRADVVFTGGRSLFEAKRGQHPNIHPFPSSIDCLHFAAARVPQPDPADQLDVPHPRVGFFGVLDERFDRELISQLAAEHPDWHFVLIGPVVKIQAHDLPHSANLHYLGQRSYSDLPAYLAGWDVAILPFARNRSTRFISPTKTPEYLAAAKPVVSTSIHDVVHPYGDLGLVRIADDAASFGEAIEACLQGASETWLEQVDQFLEGNSWDKTFEAMIEKLESFCVGKGQDAHLSERQKGNLANV